MTGGDACRPSAVRTVPTPLITWPDIPNGAGSSSRRPRALPGSGSPRRGEADEDLPLYLRRFRERGEPAGASAALLEVDGERFTREFAGASRDKEIVPPPERKAQEDFATEIRIIRHGITQGYRPTPA